VSVRVLNSLQWWQCLAVVVGLAVVICSATPLAMSADQSDDESAPVIVIARMRVNWCSSTQHTTNRSSTSTVPTIVVADDDHLQSKQDKVYPKHVDGRSLLASSCSLRC
jgi:hypothetical protein